jgi:UDP:flavonoid glycosyltransferase YjiC (YdhE family)
VGAAGPRPARDADVIVAHGGPGTTLGALAFGVPLVLIPLFADQPVNADRVASTGAALVAAPSTGPDGIRAITRDDARRFVRRSRPCFSDDAYARAARRISDELRELSSLDSAVAALASLLAPTDRPTVARRCMARM